MPNLGLCRGKFQSFCGLQYDRIRRWTGGLGIDTSATLLLKVRISALPYQLL